MPLEVVIMVVLVVVVVMMVVMMVVVHYAQGSFDHGYASSCVCGYNDDVSGSLCLCRLKPW